MDPAFAQHDTIFSNMIYMYSYSLYLFFDFAGYSSFVIGVSYMMGIKTPKTSISHSLVVILKTWNRWHMSLSFGSVILFTCVSSFCNEEKVN